MYKVEQIYVKFEESDSIEHQGNKRSIERFREKGYNIVSEKNGFYVLNKPAKVILVGGCGENGTYIHDAKDQILQYYGRRRISEKLVKEFKKDFDNGVISIEMDQDSYKIIKT